VPVRVKIRLRVTRFVSCVSKICLRVTRVGIRASHCVFVCLCASCVSRVMRVTRVTRVRIIACHACRVSCVSGSVAVRFVSMSSSCMFAVRVCFCVSLELRDPAQARFRFESVFRQLAGAAGRCLIHIEMEAPAPPHLSTAGAGASTCYVFVCVRQLPLAPDGSI
jgi:hypothetical protein